MKILYPIILIYLFAGSLFAQETIETPYFPFSEGDTLVYSVHEFGGQFIEDSRIVFTKDSLDEKRTRHLLIEYDGYRWPIADKFEVDSLGNVYADNWWGGFREKIFNQNSKENDPWIVYRRDEGYELASIRSLEETTIFGTTDTVKGIEYYYHWEDSTSEEGLQRNYAEWSKQFGVTYKADSEGGPQHILKGVVKNGHVYGNTMAVFVSTDNERELPETVRLFQNYPNPFNPTTQVRFTLPQQSEMSLVVYDMLGREVMRLVDEVLPAGEQTVRFDASNLANGVYLYRLKANQQERVRMMTLMK